MSSRMAGWMMAATLLLPLALTAEPLNSDSHNGFKFRFGEATVAQLQAAMANGSLTSEAPASASAGRARIPLLSPSLTLSTRRSPQSRLPVRP